jgi:hypothetical protein
MSAVLGTRYFAFVDPSGGSSDSMVLAIASREGDTAILHAVREVVPPFSPSSAVTEFADLLKSYGIDRVSGDRYAGMWPREQFHNAGIAYVVADKNTSEIYQAFLPLVNSGRVDLLDVPKLRNQLIALERKTSRGGRDTIGHPPGGHDDVANAAAGAIVAAMSFAGHATFTFDGINMGPGGSTPAWSTDPIPEGVQDAFAYRFGRNL